MNLLESVRTALEMIAAHKLRAFFTVLGTVVGVTFLIAVITLIQGLDSYMKNEFASQIYGVNSVMIRRAPSVRMTDDAATVREWRRRPQLTFEDAAWLAQRVETPGFIAYSSATGGRVDVPGGRAIEGVRITGASASYFRSRSMAVDQGRLFQQQEEERGLPVAVIGHDVADRLFENVNPLGRTIRIQNFPYLVIGVLERQGSLFGISMDNQVIAPARSRVDGFVNPRGVLDEIIYQVDDVRYFPAAQAELEGWMRIRHQLRPDEPNSFELETAEASLGFWTRISRVLFIALPGLVGISLVVGAVVIMNIMLVSVTERTREIGLRKSLGARRADIMSQFLIEAGTLSGVGGLAGIGLGIGLAALVSALSPLPATVAPWSIALGLLLGVGVGMAAGAYPAYRAARLDPIEALRHE
jgi:putative ABC transport system permease protein